MAKLIYVDESGKVLSEKDKGRGRPPRGSEKQANGDFIVRPTKDDSNVVKSEYVTLDDSGNVVKRESRGRGRPRPGYTKAVDGPHAGHWVGKEVVTVVTTDEKKETVVS